MSTEGAPLTVLVVDDEKQLLRLMTKVLERAGHRVLVAEDAERGLAAFRAEREAIDTVVLDVGLPPSGAEPVLDVVLAERPGTGIVLASGDLLSEDLRERLKGLGGHFLRKPFVPKALQRAVLDAATGG